MYAISSGTVGGSVVGGLGTVLLRACQSFAPMCICWLPSCPGWICFLSLALPLYLLAPPRILATSPPDGMGLLPTAQAGGPAVANCSGRPGSSDELPARWCGETSLGGIRRSANAPKLGVSNSSPLSVSPSSPPD